MQALGIKLKEYGHRVRLASHAVYRSVVIECGLEFFPLGGDPKVLSEYIVKNRGIIPSSAKDAVANYKQVEAVVMSTYDACTASDPEGDGQPFRAQVRKNSHKQTGPAVMSCMPPLLCMSATVHLETLYLQLQL